jgi:uncharacterized protein (DUF2164 family)
MSIGLGAYYYNQAARKILIAGCDCKETYLCRLRTPVRS